MSDMFYECSSLEKLNLLFFSSSNVTKMSGMFNGCKNLKNIIYPIHTINANNLINLINTTLELKK